MFQDEVVAVLKRSLEGHDVCMYAHVCVCVMIVIHEHAHFGYNG